MSLGTTNTARALKAAWLVACAAVLVAFMIWRGKGEAQDYLSWTMLVLSFPVRPSGDPIYRRNRVSGANDLTATLFDS